VRMWKSDDASRHGEWHHFDGRVRAWDCPVGENRISEGEMNRRESEYLGRVARLGCVEGVPNAI
jgi:hypothetical protein